MPEKTAVAWCKGCFDQGWGFYLLVDEAGTTCPSDECGCTLRRRVGYICKLGCENEAIFFDRKVFEEDQQDHKYEAELNAAVKAKLCLTNAST